MVDQGAVTAATRVVVTAVSGTAATLVIGAAVVTAVSETVTTPAIGAAVTAAARAPATVDPALITTQDGLPATARDPAGREAPTNPAKVR